MGFHLQISNPRLTWGRPSVLALLLWFFIASPAALAQEGETAWEGRAEKLAAIEIRIQNPYPGPDWQDLAGVLMGLKPGDTLDADRLEQAQRALAPLARVRTRVERRPEGLHLSVEMTPYPLIKSIDVQGNYPLLEKEVRKAMTVASGSIFREDQMPEQESAIARRYRDEGYIDPQVQIAWEQQADGHYRLKVKIDKGPHYLLEEVLLRGNHAIGDNALKARMSTWRRDLLTFGRGRFMTKQLQEDVRTLVNYYRAQGFADATIGSETSVRGPQQRQVVCVLNIQEGARYSIVFEGNAFFSERRLRKDLVLFESGNRGNIGLRRSINQIRRRYVEAGFADVQVHWREQAAASQQTREIAIEIQEGQRRIVEQIAVEGNRSVDEETIRRQMLTRPPGLLNSGAFAAEVLRQDVIAVEQLYRNRGHIDVRVDQKVDFDPAGRAQVLVRIEEGPATRVAKVELQGVPPAVREPLPPQLRLKPGEPYVQLLLKEDEDRLASAVSPHGYPYVDVQGAAALSDDRTLADVRYDVAPGQHVQVGRMFVLGNFKTSESFMRRELGFKSGDDFSLKQVLEGQRKLRDLDIFDSVQVHTIGLREKQDTVHMLLQTVEREPYYFVAGGGYQSDKGFYGRTRLGDHNFTGTARDLWLGGEISQTGYRAESGIGEPRLLGTMIRADAALFVERSEPLNQDFGTSVRGARLTLSRSWEKLVAAGLSVRYERREQFLREESALTLTTDPNAFEPRAIVVVTPSVVYDSRDSFIRPTRGYLLSAGVDISKGLTNTLDDFLKYRAEARTFHALLPRLTLAGRIWAGYISPYGADEPPLDQLFFLGGTSSVRGFAENQLRVDPAGNAVGGRLALAAGLEARIDLGRNFELVPFVDTGSVQEAALEAGGDSFRWSAGLGLQYITPIGPIGLFYGQNLDPMPGESNGRWHLSIGYTF